MSSCSEGDWIEFLRLDILAHPDDIVVFDRVERPFLRMEGDPVDRVQDEPNLLFVPFELQGRG
jgi:hypothetical protein